MTTVKLAIQHVILTIKILENIIMAIINKSISLVMYGIKKCSGLCLYCSAASTMNYNENGNKKTFKINKNKLRKKILEFTEVEKELKNNNFVNLTVDVWGGNPLENFNEFRQTIEFIKNNLKEFKQISIQTSGNGLELADNKKVQYLIDNNIHYQLSHDGLGQYIRTGLIDPLYYDKTKDNIAKLFKLGVINIVNCTLSSRNWSFFDNIEYWNKYREEIGLLENECFQIKLNHIYDGTPPVTKKWIFKDFDPHPEYTSLKPIKNGEEVGDLCFHGKILQNYMHEFRKLAIIMMSSGIENIPEYSIYKNYIENQYTRWNYDKDDNSSMCRSFQLGKIDKNFAIDTLGKYCQCNLIDSSTTVKNPNGKTSIECKDCIYKDQAECHPCGSEHMPEHCEFHYAWCQVLEEFAQLKEVLNSIQQPQQHNCNCEKEQPVYCVKNYNI